MATIRDRMGHCLHNRGADRFAFLVDNANPKPLFSEPFLAAEAVKGPGFSGHSGNSSLGAMLAPEAKSVRDCRSTANPSPWDRMISGRLVGTGADSRETR